MSDLEKKQKPTLVIVTGQSGAGHSVALHALEDSGFRCIDNLPFAMLESAVEFMKHSDVRAFALGMDVRDEDFAKKFLQTKSSLTKDFNVDVIFLTASEAVLTTRYTSTRRKHPLMDSSGVLSAAIKRERALLAPIEEASDCAFDTSEWSPHTLARQLEKRYQGNAPKRQLFVTLCSFGFKYGPYREADSIFDVRFLSNPYFVEGLREKTGLNEKVKEHIFSDPRTSVLLDKLTSMHEFLLPQYFEEGKQYFRLGIGCTGGRHRSVCMTEALGRRLAELDLPNIAISVSHRDLMEFSPLAQK